MRKLWPNKLKIGKGRWFRQGPMPQPDYHVSELAPELFRRLVIESGAVMLRGAVSPALLQNYSDSLAKLFATYSRISPSEFEEHLNSSDPVERDFWQQIKLSHIFDRTFEPFAGYSYFDIARASPIWDLTAQAFPESPLAQSAVCNSRRISDIEGDRFWDRPIEFHIDAQFFYDHLLSINFWTPLVPCGVDAPGLKVILLGVKATREYLEYNPEGYPPQPTDFAFMNKFRCSKMDPAVLQEQNILQHAWAPHFAAGDVLAFTNFTMHGTHYTENMTRPRTSIEVRIDLPSLVV